MHFQTRRQAEPLVVSRGGRELCRSGNLRANMSEELRPIASSAGGNVASVDEISIDWRPFVSQMFCFVFWGGGCFSSSEPRCLLLLRFFLVFSSSSPSGGVAFTASNYRRYQSDISLHTSADTPALPPPPNPREG